MKRLIILPLFSTLLNLSFGQNNLHLAGFGGSFEGGLYIYNRGYSPENLTAHTKAGLPVYLDWPLFSTLTQSPDYFQCNLNIIFRQNARPAKLRLGLSYFQRIDSFAAQSIFLSQGNLLGRQANEKAHFIGISGLYALESKIILRYFRFSLGLELQLHIAPGSKISFITYEYDTVKEEIVDLQRYNLTGKARFHLLALANIRAEVLPGKSWGLQLEVKSGMGSQFILGEKLWGISKAAYCLGINYYLPNKSE